MLYTAEDVQQLLNGGESETLEFKSSLRDPQALAQLLAAFANTKGGLIISGFYEPKQEFTGVDRQETDRVYRQAITKLQPVPVTTLDYITLNDKLIAIVGVEKNRQLILAETGAYQRVQTHVQPMSSADILTVVSAETQPLYGDSTIANTGVETAIGETTISTAVDHLQVLAEAVARQTLVIQQLQIDLSKAQGSRAKWESYVVGGFVGGIIGLILSILAKILFGL